jgi:hypothetical protein
VPEQQLFRNPLAKTLPQFQNDLLDLRQIGRFVFIIPIHQLIEQLLGFG